MFEYWAQDQLKGDIETSYSKELFVGDMLGVKSLKKVPNVYLLFMPMHWCFNMRRLTLYYILLHGTYYCVIKDTAT